MNAPAPDAAAVVAFLTQAGLVESGESPHCVPLAGGVSSDIWRVDLRSGAVCVKRALPRLRVAQLWEAPVERNTYERMWIELANGIVPGIAPRIVAHDAGGTFAMTFLPPGEYRLWKDALRAGQADASFAHALGVRLARVHDETANRSDIAARFATDPGFHALRIEPYLLATARVHADVAAQLEALAARTAATRVALVHGDVSPKNILVGPDGPVLLDAECAWYGDPAFDLAFCLNHLLLKCLWVPVARDALLACAGELVRGHAAGVHWEDPRKLERRAATLLPGLMLARVDGKSPVEYLDSALQRDCVRRFARELLKVPPGSVDAVCEAWRGELSR